MAGVLSRASLTCCRSAADSAPSTIRPSHFRTVMSPTVCLLNDSAMIAPWTVRPCTGIRGVPGSSPPAQRDCSVASACSPGSLLALHRAPRADLLHDERPFELCFSVAIRGCGIIPPMRPASRVLPLCLSAGMALATVPALDGLRAQAPAQAVLSGADLVRATYTKYEYMVPMRDGARLFTAVYVPKDASQKY